MLAFAARIFAILVLVTLGIGFAAFGAYMALAPYLEPALAGLLVGAVAILAAALLAVSPRPGRRAPVVAPAAQAELETLAALAADRPLTALALSTLVGAAEGARR